MVRSRRALPPHYLVATCRYVVGGSVAVLRRMPFGLKVWVSSRKTVCEGDPLARAWVAERATSWFLLARTDAADDLSKPLMVICNRATPPVAFGAVGVDL